MKNTYIKSRFKEKKVQTLIVINNYKCILRAPYKLFKRYHGTIHWITDFFFW